MDEDLDFTALAGMLGETIASTPGDGPIMPDRSGTSLRYFGDYELEHEIARGGMGIVYRARQHTLNRTVAVKVLRDNAFAGGDEVERFKREVGAAAALKHPHIVSIHEIGDHHGTHFFSMDYVPGGTLSQLLRDGPLPARKAADLMVKIAQAIEHAHSQGVLHRDLKPANVLLDAAGEPVVTDFGLAKHAAADAGLTVTGQVLGTPAYMAPEQAEGRMKDCGPHTDVYGLGALLYHMASGRATFTGDSHITVMHQVKHDEPVSVRLLNPSIPRDLETIYAKALSKEPPRRYHSAQDLADDVQRFLDGKPVLARPVSSVEKLWRWARRHLIHVRDRATGALRRVLRGHHATISALTFSPDGTALLSGDTRGVVKRWEVVPGKEAFPFSGTYVSNSDDGPALCWSVNAPQVRFLKWGGESTTLDVDPRGKQRHVFHDGIVLQTTGAAGRENQLSIHEPGKEPVALTLPGKLQSCSPDGRWFVYTDTATSLLMLTDRSGVRPPVQLGRGRLLSAPAFSADSRRCAIGDQNGWARVYDTATGAEVFAAAAHRSVVRGKALSRDGTVLAIAGFDGAAKLWDVATGQLRREFSGSADTLWSVALSPDGRRLAAGTGESTVILWDTATGLETGTIAPEGASGPVAFLTFTPDGAALLADGRVLEAAVVESRDP